jgi:hypothetical protein
MNVRKWTAFLIVLIVFTSALYIRLTYIFNTPNSNYSLDLQIYEAGGALISNGINPYNFKDKTALRQLLRNQSSDPWIRNKQEAWDRYASSNLPLNLMFFGVLSIIQHNPFFYRIAFAFFDSMLSVLVFIFIFLYWQNKYNNFFVLLGKWICSLVLGMISPILLQWGTIYPEDKGLEILLILVAIICALSKRKFLRYYLGAFFLGLSIAFKGLGIFFVPFYLIQIFTLKKYNLNNIIASLVILSISSLIWFIPFLPYVITMMTDRLSSNSTGIPIHASMWVWIYDSFPQIWDEIRIGVIFVLSLLGIWGYIKKRINSLNFCGIILFIFTTLYLLAGSLDRIHIGILLSILCIGSLNIFSGFFLSSLYILLGIASMKWDWGREWVESIYVFIFVCAYIINLLILIIPQKKRILLQDNNKNTSYVSDKLTFKG